jgi:hypothetical protein
VIRVDVASVFVPSALCAIFNVFENNTIPDDVILSEDVMPSVYCVPFMVQYTVPVP